MLTGSTTTRTAGPNGAPLYVLQVPDMRYDNKEWIKSTSEVGAKSTDRLSYLQVRNFDGTDCWAIAHQVLGNAM